MCPIIGLCGSHRTGKTTLAEAVSKDLAIPFFRTTTSEVFKAHGLNPADPMDFKTRLWIQDRVIDAAEQKWQKSDVSRGLITDRTPLDMLAYTLADIQGETDVDYPTLQAYSERCFQLTNALFSQLVVVQPAIPLVYEEGKAALNQAYIAHLNSLIIGLCHDRQLTIPATLLPYEVLPVPERVQFITDLIQ